MVKPIYRILGFIATRFMHPPRIKKLAKILPEYLLGATDVLDIGTGDGKLAALLQSQTGAKFVGCETVIQPSSAIEIRQYDGYSLPFENDSFQYVMLVDMLHHVRDQEQMLQEAKRVAREYVLIKDHYWETRFDRLWLGWIDYIGNVGIGVDLPYKFLREREWDDLFAAVQLSVVQVKKTRWSAADPIRQVIFKLAK